MSKLLKNNKVLNKFRNKFVLTENDALQYESTGDNCLDLFSHIGSFRTQSRQRILKDFYNAYQENPIVAAKILFWARAARKGGGERAVFHTIMEEIIQDSPKFIEDNAKLIAELGYWRDLYEYFDNRKVQDVIAEAIHNKDRLACKWAPRKGPHARKLRDLLNITNKKYRQWLKEHSETVEQQMSNEQWDNIKYESVPGQAMRKYKKAYGNHDGDRFQEWKLDDTKASVSASYPHDVIKLICNPEWMESFLDDADFDLAEKQWRNLPDHIKEGENILPMIDVSGSMSGLPMLIAVSLGLYLSEHNKGSFKDTFLTFSGSPELIRFDSGAPLKDKLHRIIKADWGMNTDFQKAYRTILDTAVSFNVPQSAMPTMLLVLSDMQFDQSQGSYWNDDKADLDYTEKLHFESIKKEFKKAGYEAPKLVFWNLSASDCKGSPAQVSDDGVAMVSGFNPVLMKAILNCEDFNPMKIMFEALKDIDVDVTNLPDELETLKLSLDREEVNGYNTISPTAHTYLS